MSAELILLVIATASAGIAAVFAVLGFLRTQRLPDALTARGAIPILRAETDIVRAAIEAQARSLRQELGQSLQGFQEITLKTRMSFIAAQFKFRVIGKIRCKFQRVDVARSATGLEQLTNVLPPKTVV